MSNASASSYDCTFCSGTQRGCSLCKLPQELYPKRFQALNSLDRKLVILSVFCWLYGGMTASRKGVFEHINVSKNRCPGFGVWSILLSTSPCLNKMPSEASGWIHWGNGWLSRYRLPALNREVSSSKAVRCSNSSFFLLLILGPGRNAVRKKCQGCSSLHPFTDLGQACLPLQSLEIPSLWLCHFPL